MKTLYIDPIGGAAGDMLCAALFDLGLDITAWKNTLLSLGLTNYTITVSTCVRNVFSAKHLCIAPIQVIQAENNSDRIPSEPWGHHHRGYSTIVNMIEQSQIPQSAKDNAIAVFRILGEAEAKVHGCALEEVHFHEVGAVDSILDIVGFCLGIEMLGIKNLYSSPPPLSSGQTTGAHGVIPLPAPATLRILQGRKTRQGYPGHEQTTPTGAAILAALTKEAPFPSGTIGAIGYGAGTRNPKAYSNIVRVTCMETESSKGDIYELRTQVDDMIGEALPLLFERCLEHGAIDIFAQSIVMKKGRMGYLITVLVRNEYREQIEDVIFQNTTTLGIRRSRVDRTELSRRRVPINTPWGIVHMKEGRKQDRLLQASVEYEDAARVARNTDLSLQEIYDHTRKLWRQQ